MRHKKIIFSSDNKLVVITTHLLYKPDFALILTPDKENEYYTPETILPLDAVYQNARLIAKPDDTWLNPDTIL